MRTTLWKLPVPSTALLGGGPSFEKRLGREVAIRLSYETEEGVRAIALVFKGVEAFKCTYFRACDASMLDAYDRLVDRGGTAWLDELRANLGRNGGTTDRLVHMMIMFDDGPCYELICGEFRLETVDRAGFSRG